MPSSIDITLSLRSGTPAGASGIVPVSLTGPAFTDRVYLPLLALIPISAVPPPSPTIVAPLKLLPSMVAVTTDPWSSDAGGVYPGLIGTLNEPLVTVRLAGVIVLACASSSALNVPTTRPLLIDVIVTVPASPLSGVDHDWLPSLSSSMPPALVRMLTSSG